MTAEDEQTLRVQIANQFINTANSRLEDGIDPRVIAEGLRHSAANFSAFVNRHGGDGQTDPVAYIEEFATMLEYYLERHGPGNQAAAGLKGLIDQAKNEI